MQFTRAFYAELSVHLARHVAENGLNGTLFMAPQSFGEVHAGYLPVLWNEPAGEGPWQRVWGWLDDAGTCRAHVVVTGGQRPASAHRCELAAGVEAPFRRQGLGRHLMGEALAWVRAQPQLSWVDGWAFANNAPVLALDREMGFEEVGRVRDVLRVGGQSLDQVLMTIDLRGGA